MPSVPFSLLSIFNRPSSSSSSSPSWPWRSSRPPTYTYNSLAQADSDITTPPARLLSSSGQVPCPSSSSAAAADHLLHPDLSQLPHSTSPSSSSSPTPSPSIHDSASEAILRPRNKDLNREHSLSTPLIHSHSQTAITSSPEVDRFGETAAMRTARTRRGAIRAYWLATIVCMGGFLFGYDSGIVGGVLTLDSYQKDYVYDDESATRVNSLCVGMQQLGAFIGCFLVWPMTSHLGRKKSLMLSSAVFCIGAAIQTINTHSLSTFYAARVIAGLGLGSASVVVPMFNSEMAPKEIRARVGSFFQFFFTIGIFTSYWVDYAVAKAVKSSSMQWQIPVGLQLVPAGILGLGMLSLPESCRWLTKKGRYDEAWESLIWIRADSGPATQYEMQEIRAGVASELRATENFRIKELFDTDNGNFKRICTAFIMFMAQQATGATAFAYFGPQYFKLLVNNDETDLLLTALFGAVKVIACGTFIVLLAERVNRRSLLIGGALFMSACQLTTGAVVHKNPPSDDGKVSGSGMATVALIYLFVIAYNLSWGPLPWPYVSEIFPARIREPGIATGVASQWLFNFVYSLTTPYMIAKMEYGTFLLWGLFDLFIALGTWAFLRETRGLSLEEIAGSRFRRNSRAAMDVNHDGEELGSAPATLNRDLGSAPSTQSRNVGSADDDASRKTEGDGWNAAAAARRNGVTVPGSNPPAGHDRRTIGGWAY